MSDAAAARELGGMLAGIVFPVLIIVGGFALSRFLNRDRDFSKKQVRWPILTAFAIAVLSLIAQFSVPDKQSPETKSESWVVVRKTPLSKPWPKDLDEAETVSSFAKPLQTALEQELQDTGNEQAAKNLKVDGTVLQNGSQPLVWISISAENTLRSDAYISVKGTDQVLVGCMQYIDATTISEECNNKVQEIFGYIKDRP